MNHSLDRLVVINYFAADEEFKIDENFEKETSFDFMDTTIKYTIKLFLDFIFMR
jgi:hypothetical protein